MTLAARGRLRDPSSAPLTGERVEELARVRNLVVEQILSGELDWPTEHLQQHDEFVVLLAGGAVLEVDGAALDLRPGDWVLLPARTAHRLVSAKPGTSWLTVHLHGS